MEGLNKFKVLTVAFILMFIFIVAAIYSNTKDAAKSKNKLEKTDTPRNNTSNAASYGNTAQLERLSIRINELSERVDNLSNDDNKLKCSIQGVLDGNTINEMSTAAAVQEARDNDKELVMICSFQ
ncbi:hypothetical protein HDR58_05290 [bacterium]|nr:hypothetical protein [bacterium]